MMKFVDFGDFRAVLIENIRLLPTQFQELPCLAVSVKLTGMSVCYNFYFVKLLVRQQLNFGIESRETFDIGFYALVHHT